LLFSARRHSAVTAIRLGRNPNLAEIARDGRQAVPDFRDEISFNVDLGRCVFMGDSTSEEEQRHFYKSLLKLPWLASKVRYAIMKELGLSLRERNREHEHVRMLTIYLQIKEREARLRHNRERPRGGIHDKAVEDVAQALGMSVTALKKRLERAKLAAQDRRYLKHQALTNLKAGIAF
jgi:hypothetical protein